MTEDILVAFRVGSVLLLDNSLHDPVGQHELQERGDLVKARVNQLIAESPIVTERPAASLNGPLTPLHVWSEGEYRHALCFEEPAVFRVHWPSKNQETFGPYAGPFVQDFTIAFDGFGFACAARCAHPLPRPYSFVFGREGRRILETILGGESEWEISVIGPSPMYVVPYICFTAEPTDYSPDFELRREGDTLETLTVLSSPKRGELESTVQDALGSLLHATQPHFYSLVARSECMHRQVTLNNAFQAAAEAHTRLLTVAGWKPTRWLQRLTATRTIRSSVGSAYAEYVELIEIRRSLEQEVRDAKEAFQRHPLLAPASDYCEQFVEDIFKWSGEHVLHGLSFFGEESRTQGLEIATIQAAALGAFIAGATAAVLWLLG